MESSLQTSQDDPQLRGEAGPSRRREGESRIVTRVVTQHATLRCYVTISCCPGLQGDNRRGPAFHWNVLVDQRAAAARAHCGQGRDLLLQGEVRKPII